MLNKKKEIEEMKTKFIDLNIKEKIAIMTAVAAFVLGWILSILGFYEEPKGDVSNSVLWILGQALLYAASVFGVSSYFSAEAVAMKADINRHIEKMEHLRLQRENLRSGKIVEEIPIEEDES